MQVNMNFYANKIKYVAAQANVSVYISLSGHEAEAGFLG